MRATPPQLPAPGASEEQDDLIGLLHARGRRVTSQRLVILRELRRRGHHATADEIHRAVYRDLPGTSTPTVYATLELLVELGLVRRIDAGTGSTLYDARADPHQHAVCRVCGQIEDVDGELEAGALVRSAHERGFVTESAELVISGVCRRCARAAGDWGPRRPRATSR